MKWVKTSEKLPNKKDEYFIILFSHISQTKTPKDVWEYAGEEDNKIWLNCVEEWLDESEELTDTDRLDQLETILEDSTTNFLYDYRDNQFKFTLREFIDKQIKQ